MSDVATRLKRQMLSPDRAATLPAVCSLQTDGDNVPSGWIQITEDRVTLCNQKSGHPATGTVEFSKREFAQLAHWYFTPQKTRVRP
jgi:hypothetical protein